MDNSQKRTEEIYCYDVLDIFIRATCELISIMFYSSA